MKRKLKIGDSQIITITDNGTVIVPGETKMSISEIADLFGIYYLTAKRHIRAIEKAGIARGDDSKGGSVEGLNVYPDYYGLEMVIAIAFRVRSANADIFRKWLVHRITRHGLSQTIFLSLQNLMLN
ncbi:MULTISPECIES: hypothetical protein [Proteiniphilum]|jgi:hypothetical protein|uniref:hypothetical protein n=1 Tax=Proteiniphilum TaxID=294702 RepID=UPI00092B5E47|nr:MULTISPECIES: hypothetical protein [Proteiniphilum]MDY9917468.1 hypothetical protein [Proteiniphilum sp.]OJV85837.1 MAG: hypothetical protein BGO34_02685 [Bacteroidia bacterium 44-10]